MTQGQNPRADAGKTPGAGKRPGAETREVALLLLLGLGMRVAWMILADVTTRFLDMGEATRAAIALAEQGVIADAYFPGQGPTAHLMPAMILVAGALFHLFGVDSAGAALALAGWAMAQMLCGFALLYCLFRKVEGDRRIAFAGLALLCLSPAYIAQEAADFRYWEGGLGVCLGTANLLLIVMLDGRERIGTPALLFGALLAGAAFFVSPPVGVAVDACWAWLAFRRLSPLRILGFAGMGAAGLALFLVPWTMRNQAVMGEPIFLRSNFGLEIAIANHPAAVSGENPRETLRARMAEIHPFSGPQAAERMKAAGGEVAYSRMLGEQTRAWIAANPWDFLRLTLRHYRQFYIPDMWQEALTNWHAYTRPRILFIRTVGVLGLIGLCVGLIRRRRYYGYLALYIALVGLPYAIVQPIPRYSYLVWGLFCFLTVGLFADGARMVRARRARRQSANDGPGTAR